MASARRCSGPPPPTPGSTPAPSRGCRSRLRPGPTTRRPRARTRARCLRDPYCGCEDRSLIPTPSTTMLRVPRRTALLLSASMPVLAGCHRAEGRPTLFELLPAERTGVTFVNRLPEDTAFNILTYLYYYNGGGVAVGDVNNDRSEERRVGKECRSRWSPYH